MIGLFNLHGPLRINEVFKVVPANFSFNKEHAILYIDQPVGTGYSYVDEPQGDKHNTRPDCFDQNGYSIDQCGVGLDLMEFLVKFGTVFPEAHTRPMYLLGESYAGKYLPTLASHILDHNEASGIRDQFNLRGFAIGDGLTDPETQIRHYGKLALSFGLANPNQANEIDQLAEKAIASAREGHWVQASSYRNDLFNYYRNITNNVDYYDIRNGDLPHQWKHMEKFLNQANVKSSVHFPAKRSFFRDPKVVSSMQGDIMRSVVHLFPKFEGLKMMFFQGQFDYRDGPMSQFDWLYQTFPCLKEAQAKIWEVDGHTAGYRTACHGKEVSQVTVLQAGHMVSLTQPARGLDLLNWFIKANTKP
ncbi:hypothetical protein DSO57_1005405 [Entomophthora muscae]|uniref:Uncharacterized protein n=1 Tax=Entomophthora muscae TaxID=34485 RepID=A0ACC2TVQ4_9FUNG|nr:hypothetical protein DSO57_1005405 [Entomophthora muscae]